MFAYSHTVPSAVRSSVMKERVKSEHRHEHEGAHTHTGVIACRHGDGRSSLSFVCCLHAAIYHTKRNDCRLVINELLNMSEPPGAITERVQVQY